MCSVFRGASNLCSIQDDDCQSTISNDGIGDENTQEEEDNEESEEVRETPRSTKRPLMRDQVSPGQRRRKREDPVQVQIMDYLKIKAEQGVSEAPVASF